MESLTLGRRKVSKNELLAGIGGSFMVHLLALTAAFVATWAMPHHPVKPPFCTVNLVSLRDIGSGNSEPKGDPKAPEAAKVSEAPKPAARVSEKSEPVMPVVKRLQLDETSRREEAPIKKIEPKEAPKIAEAPQNLADIEKNLDKLIAKPKVVPRTTSPSESAAESSPKPAAQVPPAPAHPVRPNASTAESAGRGTPSGSVDAGAKGATQGSTSGSLEGTSAASALVGLYGNKVREAIQREWRLVNDQSLTGLKAVLEVQIRKNGEVINVQVVKPSGNPMFDDAAKRAVMNAAPLPAVPEVIVQSSTRLILTFLPGSIS
jgi:TonB family protein